MKYFFNNNIYEIEGQYEIIAQVQNLIYNKNKLYGDLLVLKNLQTLEIEIKYCFKIDIGDQNE